MADDVLALDVIALYNHPAFPRILKLAARQRGEREIKALEALHSATEGVTTLPHQKRTVRDVLGLMSVDADTVAGELKVLERRDEAYMRLLEQELRELDEGEIGGSGIKVERVGGRSYDLAVDAARLSSTAPMSAGGTQIIPTGSRVTEVPLRPDAAARVLANAEVQEERLARARRAQPGAWDGDAGRTAFQRIDRETAESGYDHVARLEREGSVAHARASAAAKAQTLDAAIAQGKTPQQRMLLLDGAISELGLGGPGTSVLFGAALTNKPALTGLPPITPFEPARDAGVKQLDEPGEGSPEGRAMHERILRILDERGLGISGHYVDVLDELLGNTPAPAATKPEAPIVLEGAEGIYQPNHDLHQQVLARLASKGLDIRSYQRELEAMGAEANEAQGGSPTEYRR